MYVALREMRRAKLRFGLLVGAVGLLVFLILFQRTLLDSLVDAMNSAITSQTADVLVVADDARGQLDASILDPELVAEVESVDGVEAAAPWQLTTFSAHLPGGDELTDVTVVGYEPEGPGSPATIVQGRPVEGPGETVVPAGHTEEGLEVGAVINLEPDAGELEVVGVAEGLQYVVRPALFVDAATYEELVLARSPEAPLVPVNAVAVSAEDPGQLESVRDAIEASVAGVSALSRQAAADGIPGVDAISQSFMVILVLAFAVVGLVTGIFFLILTVQKSDALTLLRAVGASHRDVVVPLVFQVTFVILSGVAVGVGMLAAIGAFASDASGLEVGVDLPMAASTGAVLLLLGLVAALASVRRVLRIEPFEVTTRSNVGGAL